MSEKVELNKHGVNKKIKANILDDKTMREIGFTDFSKDNWHFCRIVIHEYSKKGYGGIDFEVSFNVSIPKNGDDIRIDVLDEAFCQPYDYQYMLDKNPNFGVALKVKEEVEKWMAYLKEKGVLEGHEYGEYI